MTELPEPVLRERFGLVAEAARDNLGAAIDLVLVHNEKEVRGRQPRASLNRAVVVMAIGAWDRFIADTCSAFTTGPDSPTGAAALMTQSAVAFTPARPPHCSPRRARPRHPFPTACGYEQRRAGQECACGRWRTSPRMSPDRSRA